MLLHEISFNAAEAIPYKDFKDKNKIIADELKKNRYIEIWDKFIYSAEKWRGGDGENIELSRGKVENSKLDYRAFS